MREREYLVQEDGVLKRVPEHMLYKFQRPMPQVGTKESGHEETVYARFIEFPMDKSEMEAANLLLYLELYTIESIDSAYEYFVNHNQNLPDYEPYSCVFTVTGDAESSINQKCLSVIEQCKKRYGWIKGKLRQNSDDNEGLRGHVSLTSGEPLNGELSLELDLTFVPEKMSANDPNLKSLKSALNVAAEISEGILDIPDNINGLPPKKSPESGSESNPYTVTVYKVGAANAITIQKNGKCILFDCGRSNPINSTADTEICNVKPDILIISHWHEDHFDLLGNSAFDFSNLRLIIFPRRVDIRKSKYQQIRVKLGLLKNRGVTLLQLVPSKPFSPDFLSNYGFDNIYINLGKNRTAKKSSPYGYISYSRDPDDTGIILSIKSCKGPHYAILPGDCSYYSWPKVVTQKLINTKHLVVPHHGGHVLTTAVPSGVLPSNSHIYVSTSQPAFVDLNINSKGSTRHKSFIDAVFVPHDEHLTSLLTHDKISFDI